MNASPHFRYYLALVLLVLLGLAIRVQNGADVTSAPGQATADAGNPALMLAKTR
ncbi:MAG: hypothetical protein ACRYFK_14705 [Janthinobacterium lividum]